MGLSPIIWDCGTPAHSLALHPITATELRYVLGDNCAVPEHRGRQNEVSLFVNREIWSHYQRAIQSSWQETRQFFTCFWQAGVLMEFEMRIILYLTGELLVETHRYCKKCWDTSMKSAPEEWRIMVKDWKAGSVAFFCYLPIRAVQPQSPLQALGIYYCCLSSQWENTSVFTLLLWPLIILILLNKLFTWVSQNALQWWGRLHWISVITSSQSQWEDWDNRGGKSFVKGHMSVVEHRNTGIPRLDQTLGSI